MSYRLEQLIISVLNFDFSLLSDRYVNLSAITIKYSCSVSKLLIFRVSFPKDSWHIFCHAAFTDVKDSPGICFQMLSLLNMYILPFDHIYCCSSLYYYIPKTSSVTLY